VGRWWRPSLVVEVGGRAVADSGWRCSEAPRPQEIGGLRARLEGRVAPKEVERLQTVVRHMVGCRGSRGQGHGPHRPL
jgi:hypothetical protein